MEILLLSYYCRSVDGTLTSILDAYYNLKRFGLDVKFKVISDNVNRTLKDFLDNFGVIPDGIEFDSSLEYESDIIICSSRLLYNTFSKPLDNLFLNYKKIIILDSLDIYISPEKLDDMVLDAVLLCQPMGLSKTNLECYEYYHKFSYERLSNEKHKQVAMGVMDNEYRRSSVKLGKPSIFENIGKKIFENIYYGKEINYFNEDIEDGLIYYLKLFDVYGYKDHIPLPIKKEDIEDKLFMKENDRLLKLCRG